MKNPKHGPRKFHILYLLSTEQLFSFVHTSSIVLPISQTPYFRTAVKGSSASAPAAAQSESAEDVKLDKAAAKEAKMARQKAAKEAQQAAIDAALAAAAAAKE